MLYPKTNRVMLIDCSSIKKYLMDSYKHERKSRIKKQQNDSGKFLTEDPLKKLNEITKNHRSWIDHFNCCFRKN